jgi:rhodanese-related sulfurtransferase
MKYLNKKNVILACLFWIFGLFTLAGYAHTAQQAADVNEARILLDFFENERDYFHEGGSFVITAQNLRLNVLTKPNVNYPPAEKPFKRDTHLLTLSTEIPNVLYCYTGQTSAYASGYLRLLGYDARSLLFGTNGMVYDLMLENNVNNTFMPEKEIMDYDYVSGK